MWCNGGIFFLSFSMKSEKLSWYFFVLIAGVFLFISPVLGDNTDIIINEIGAYESSGNEWIEIFNRADEPIDLSEWKFWEGGVNHGLTVKQGQSILAPGEFAVIVQDDEKFLLKYPLVTSTIFDSSWGSLSEDGEEIGLKFAAGENDFVEKFVYVSSTDFSLERKDVSLDDYTENNWTQHASGNTVGVQNSNVVSEEGEPVVEEVPEEIPEEEPVREESQPDADEDEEEVVELEPEPAPEVFVTPTPKIVINEFLSDPADGEEWIELYNTGTSSVNLEGFTLSDGAGVIAHPTSTVEAGAFIVFELSSSKLNNGGDIILLKNVAGEVVDSVSFGEWNDGNVEDNVVAPAQGNTVARKVGIDTNNDKEDWQETTTPTKGTENIITAPVLVEPPTKKVSRKAVPKAETISVPTTPPKKAVAPGTIVINELFPNPAGSDNAAEFIELYNTSSSSVSLVGWKIGDKSNQRYTIQEKVIEPHSYAVFLREITGISLNNTGEEEVKIFDPAGNIIDEVLYTATNTENLSFARTSEKKFAWTTTVTIGKENIFTSEDKLIVEEEDVEKTEPVQDFSVLRISEVFPAPVKFDTKEFVEVFNSGEETLDLGGISIDDSVGGSKPYQIPEGIQIQPGEYKAFFQTETRLVFNNNTDSARILDTEKSVIDDVTYEKIKINQSYIQDENGDGVWTTTLTPDEENILTVIVENEQAPKKVLGQKITAPFEVPLENIRELDKGEMIITKGTVAVEPGILGSQYFYIVGETTGVQVYNNKKDFPDLKIGDEIEVRGELTLAYGETRLKTNSAEDIVVMSSEAKLVSQEVEIGLINENFEGAFVKIRGEVTEVKSTYMYVDDGTNEIKVAFKPGSSIRKGDIVLGSTVSVQGIVSQAQSGYHILPRSQGDIALEAGDTEPKHIVQETVLTETTEASNGYFWPFLLMGLGGLGAVYWRRKELLGWWKK